jgi:pentatricopeptide repeat protein
MGLCVAWNEWDYVSKVLDLMQRHGLLHQQQQLDYSTYRTSLQMCWEFGNAKSAQDVLQAMYHAQLSPKPTDVGLVVSTLCQCSKNTNEKNHNIKQGSISTTQWRKGWNILQSAATVPCSKTEYSHHNNDKTACHFNSTIPIKTYHDVLDAMKREKQWKDSIRCLRWMEKGNGSIDETITVKNKSSSTIGSDPSIKPHGFDIPTPTLSTYQTVIECCLENHQVDAAVQILYDATKKNTEWTLKPSTFQVVLAALAKKLQWREALHLLDFMVEWNIPRTVVTYNTVISACAKAREVGMAKSLLYRMKQRDHVRPDEISYNAVIGACANTARWKEALDMLDQCYREPGVTPNIFIYTNAMR